MFSKGLHLEQALNSTNVMKTASAVSERFFQEREREDVRTGSLS